MALPSGTADRWTREEAMVDLVQSITLFIVALAGLSTAIRLYHHILGHHD